MKHCFAIFIDYEKAFELADPKSILHTLTVDKGVNGSILGWLQDFLSHRKGYTIVQGQESDVFSLFQGTPQGSVLSPYLFNILMDKVLTVLYKTLGEDRAPKVTVISYADDLVLISNHADAPSLLTNALSNLESISSILGLQINSSKTKAMAWNHSHNFPPFSFLIYNTPIEWVRQFKYLGVIFDDNLSFVSHSKHICNRASKRLSVLKHIAGSPYGATQRTLLQYYKTCIRPILEYGSITMSIACPSAIRRIEALQNTSLRIALRLPPNTRTALVLAEAGCPTIDDRMKTLSMVAYTKIKAVHHHPFHQYSKNMHIAKHLLGKYPKRGRDLPLEMSLIETSSMASLPQVPYINIPAIRPDSPTLSSYMNIDIKLPTKSKSDMTNLEIAELRQSVMTYIESQFKNHFHIYVDGSVNKDTGRAASAFIAHNDINPYSKVVRVSDKVSSTQAELTAIEEALAYIKLAPSLYSHVVIHCDSHSAITSLLKSKLDPLESQVYQVLKLAQNITKDHHITLTLHWIPSHIGIPGNEEVDKLVKQGLTHITIDKAIPATIGQVKSIIRRHISQCTQNYFTKQVVATSDNEPKSAAFRRYLSLNPSLHPQKFITSSPATQRTINRLRCDTESWCYQHATNTNCVYCDALFSTEHYILDCPVTARPSFTQLLDITEHAACPNAKATSILKRMSSSSAIGKEETALSRHPIRTKCRHPEHGIIPYTSLTIPKGL